IVENFVSLLKCSFPDQDFRQIILPFQGDYSLNDNQHLYSVIFGVGESFGENIHGVSLASLARRYHYSRGLRKLVEKGIVLHHPLQCHLVRSYTQPTIESESETPESFGRFSSESEFETEASSERA